MQEVLSAWAVRRYGGPEALSPVERAVPTPSAKQLLIRIHASAVTRADGMMRAGRPKFARLFLGLNGPHAELSGTCFSGEVIAVGAGASRYGVGDEIFGLAGMQFGANASHICLDESAMLMRKPDTLSHEEAAVLCDGPMTSWHFLTEVARVSGGERVLILAGAGSLGSAAVQIAKALGAEVTATSSARNLKTLRHLGAQTGIDYSTSDPMRSGAGFDVIFDTLGVSSFGQAKHALVEGGRYICPVLGLRLIVDMLTSRVLGRKSAGFAAAGLQKPEVLRGHLGQILELIAEGQFSPLMDRTYPLSDLVEAHRYVESGHKTGNVVVV